MRSKFLIVLGAIVTASCTHNNVETGLAKRVQIPNLPPNLEIKAEKLDPLPDATMGTAHVRGAEDDMKYNSVAFQLNKLIDLYNCVKVSVNTNKEIEGCLK